MDYHDRKTAKVAIMAELSRRGWKIYGYKEDKSDSMTDYFDPASWEGVASKDGAVVCVDVGSFTVKECSGGRTRHRSVPAEPCKRCKATGEEPEGWTLTQAKASPREFNRQYCAKRGSGMNMLPDVVSPAHFIDYGPERCADCSGMKHKFKMESHVEPWPTFQANPNRRNWHVEKDGKILDSGIGLKGCVFGEAPEVKANINRIVDKMEAAALGKTATKTDKPTKTTAKPADIPSGPVMAKFAVTGAWTWLTFTSKPSDEVLDVIKGDGWRWSKKRTAWYNLDGKTPPACVTYSQTA